MKAIHAPRASMIALVLFVAVLLNAQQAGTTKVNRRDGQTYVWVPGSFTMGCSPGDSKCNNNERPAHTVTIARGFWLGQTPVTQGAYFRATGMSNPSRFKGDNLPVERVKWIDANQYCVHIHGRLPKEAEWEYAARAGSERDRYGDLNHIAWYDGNSAGHTHPVGQKRPNSWGLYDMLGNVWQWTDDWYGAYTADSDDSRGPAPSRMNATGDHTKTLRGGSYNSGSNYVRVSDRGDYAPSGSGFGFGFRCVSE
jgi:formylglycine-generating enzyme required for sulfatase activity